jgi:hypothetical protein
MVLSDALARVDHVLATVFCAESWICRSARGQREAGETVDAAEERYQEWVLRWIVEVAHHGADEGAVGALPFEAGSGES